uniref:G_PROTEIN_RECEP_F1_2 domain-containing protein n=1 Tax=Heterorhabditis bacteriophora TaxID=37862 RepID=A0A1I7WPT5_HETBA
MLEKVLVESRRPVHSFSAESFARHTTGPCRREELVLFDWPVLDITIAWIILLPLGGTPSVIVWNLFFVTCYNVIKKLIVFVMQKKCRTDFAPLVSHPFVDWLSSNTRGRSRLLSAILCPILNLFNKIS